MARWIHYLNKLRENTYAAELGRKGVGLWHRTRGKKELTFILWGTLPEKKKLTYHQEGKESFQFRGGAPKERSGRKIQKKKGMGERAKKTTSYSFLLIHSKSRITNSREPKKVRGGRFYRKKRQKVKKSGVKGFLGVGKMRERSYSPAQVT